MLQFKRVQTTPLNIGIEGKRGCIGSCDDALAAGLEGISRDGGVFTDELSCAFHRDRVARRDHHLC